MKRIWAVSVIIVLTALFFMACGEEPQADIESDNDQPDVLHTCGFALYINLYANELENLEMEVVDSRMMAGEEEFLRELMAGSNEPDIYVVWDYEYWENRVFTDLSVSEILVDCVEKMHEVLKDSAYQGGELAGIPVRVMGTVMAYNQASDGYPLANGRGVDWDDFLMLSDEIAPQYTIMANKAGLYQMLFEQYIYEYGEPIAGNVDFDTEAFRKVLDIMKQIHDSPHFQEPGTGAMASYGNDYDFRATDIIGINHLVVTDLIGNLRGLPAIDPDNTSASQIKVAYAVVNPNSERKEIAIHYLERMVTGKAYLETAELFPMSGNDSLNEYMEEAMVCYDLDLYRTVSVDLDRWLKNQASLYETMAAIQEKSDLFFGGS